MLGWFPVCPREPPRALASHCVCGTRSGNAVTGVRSTSHCASCWCGASRGDPSRPEGEAGGRAAGRQLTCEGRLRGPPQPLGFAEKGRLCSGLHTQSRHCRGVGRCGGAVSAPAPGNAAEAGETSAVTLVGHLEEWTRWPGSPEELSVSRPRGAGSPVLSNPPGCTQGGPL